VDLDRFLAEKDRLPTAPAEPSDVRGRRVVAFDLETTGLDPEADRIVEFCFIELDDALTETSRWTQRVNPGIPIPAEVTLVHGIRDADVAHEPGFDAFAARVQALLDDAILMAYNHGFDLNCLHYELVRHGMAGLAMERAVVDPLDIFRRFHSHSLAGAVNQYLGRDIADAHSAEGDTLAMLDVLRAQIQTHGLEPRASANLVARDRRYLDRKRCFYEDPKGVVRFGFGKYRHEPVADHVDYMQWMLGRDFPDDTKNVAKGLVDAALAPATPAQA
jgi:DNA polymerase-3 subunit epsilon